MNFDRDNILSQARKTLDQLVFSKLENALFDSDVHSLGDLPTSEKAGDLLATWMARSKNSVRLGFSIYGLDQLITNLKGMDKSAVVTGHHFASLNFAVNVYFSDFSKIEEILGVAIVDLHRPEKTKVL